MAAAANNIRFSCKCGRRFEVPQDQASSTVQCPDCGLLVDVPSFSDLDSLDDDGTLKLAPGPVRPEPTRIDTLTRIFSRKKTDEDGNEIDRRTQPEDLLNVGAPTPEYGTVDTFQKIAPRYDPVTGELLTPIEVDNAGVVRHAEIPLAQRQLEYINAAEPNGVPSTGRIAIDLIFHPGNAIAMFAIGVLQICLQYSALVSLIGFYFLVPAPLFLTLMIISHYANVVDDIGRDGKDEIPRPVRGFSFIEDIWLPFCDIALPFLLCYALAIALYAGAGGPPWVRALAGILAAVGTFLFPALFLTKVCSGHLANLRPDRVAGVIRVCSWRYFRSVVLWGLALALYYATYIAMMAQFAVFFRAPDFLYYWMGDNALSRFLMSQGMGRLTFGMAFLVMGIAIYAMHFFCWDLGLLARRHLDKFPWAYQRHHASPKPVVRRRRRPPMGQTPAPQ